MVRRWRRRCRRWHNSTNSMILCHHKVCAPHLCQRRYTDTRDGSYKIIHPPSPHHHHFAIDKSETNGFWLHFTYSERTLSTRCQSQGVTREYNEEINMNFQRRNVFDFYHETRSPLRSGAWACQPNVSQYRWALIYGVCIVLPSIYLHWHDIRRTIRLWQPENLSDTQWVGAYSSIVWIDMSTKL